MKKQTYFILKNKDYILYTWNHKKAFLKKEKQLLHKNTIAGYLHDFDKIIMYLFLDKDTTNRIHRQYAKHHAGNAKKENHFIQMMIDWECARDTKPDKKLTAYETLYMYYPYLESKMLPLLEKYKLTEDKK